MVFKRRESEGFERQSFLGTLLTPFRSVQEWVGDALSGDDSFREREGNFFVGILTLPLRLVWAFAVFMVQAWTTSRNGIAFLRGLPAFGVFAFTPFLIWALDYYDRQITLGPTMGYHRMHRENEAHENASLFSQKLVDLRPEDREFKFLLAEDTLRAGDADHAKRIMSYLAGDPKDVIPSDAAFESLIGTAQAKESVAEADASADLQNPETEAGDGSDGGDEAAEKSLDPEDVQFARAHVWLAQQLIRQNQLGGEDETDKALEHLRAAVAIDPNNYLAKVNQIDLYLSRASKADEGSETEIANLRLAKDAMVRLTGYQSFSSFYQIRAMPQLIRVCRKLGHDDEARRYLNAATEKVTQIARRFPHIFEIWDSLIRSAIALPDYDLADDFIREGRQSVKTQEDQRKILQLASVAYMQKADDFKDISTKKNFRARLFALCKAISKNARDVQIYDRLADFIDVDQGGTERDQWLRNAALDCPIPGIVHLIIGTREMIRGDIAGGKTSWNIARYQYANTEFVAHRMISVAVRKIPKIGESELLDTALELFPDFYVLHETRGMVLKERGEFEKAIEEFKYVESKIPKLATVHKHLKDCYEKTNNFAAAAESEQKLKEILEEMSEKNRKFYEKALDRL